MKTKPICNYGWASAPKCKECKFKFTLKDEGKQLSYFAPKFHNISKHKHLADACLSFEPIDK